MPLAALAAFIDIVMRFQRLPSGAPVVGLRLDLGHAKTRTSTSCMDLWGHGDLHQFDHYFIYIRKFFADNFVQYGPSLPKINQLEFASSLTGTGGNTAAVFTPDPLRSRSTRSCSVDTCKN